MERARKHHTDLFWYVLIGLLVWITIREPERGCQCPKDRNPMFFTCG